jgi:hypothetical protein
MVNHLPVETETKLVKVLDLCKKFRLDDEGRSLQISQAMRKLSQHRYGASLFWLLKANQIGRAALVANSILKEKPENGE